MIPDRTKGAAQVDRIEPAASHPASAGVVRRVFSGLQPIAKLKMG
jgi:hypothetical protein